MRIFEGKRILITGGTGSLGRVLVRHILQGDLGRPSQVIVFSRDEAKQHQMRTEYLHKLIATEEVIYRNFRELLTFRISDIRDYSAVAAAVRDVDIIFHAAALKQVPICEYFPYEAIQTNVVGAFNIVRAIRETGSAVETVVGISTDKACKPVNVMGMTKALQERILLEANLQNPATRFVCVRYGNVIGSRGSVVPLFLEQIRVGGPVTITHKDMTRFLLTLDQAVACIVEAVRSAQPGETYVPIVRSARMVDLAIALMDTTLVPIQYSGVRPGEKIHEILVSEDECHRTIERNGYLVIRPILPELQGTPVDQPAFDSEFSSERVNMSPEELRLFLASYRASPDFERSPIVK